MIVVCDTNVFIYDNHLLRKRVGQALFGESNPIPAKWALMRMGLIENGLRLPLTALDPRHVHALESALAGAGALCATASKAS